MAVKEHTHAHDEEVDADEMTADDVVGSYVPRIRPEVDGVEVDGEAVLVIEEVWSLHWLNPISTVVFNEFDGVSSIDEVAARLSRAFKADPEVVRNDVLDMTRQLARDGLLEGIEAEQPRSVAPAFEGVPLGTAVPPFEYTDLSGTPRTLEDFRGQQTFLVNWSLTCGFCSRIAPEISKLQPNLRARGVQTVFLSTGSREGLREQMEEFKLDIPVLVEETEIAEVFYGMGTPSAYLLDANGMTASELAFGAEAVPALLRQIAGVSAKGNGAKKSTRAKKSTQAKKSTRSAKAAGSRKRAAARK
ncbi:MAG: PqqD family peptide modification chaperone [Actinomycetota bacterium]